jgi:CRISPR-associated protein Csb2
MGLIIEQTFPLGRFHAARWKQGSFGDRHGEWPPSPYRLLRALAMRWFQYAREMGWDNQEEENHRSQLLYPLLESLASDQPSFYLPAASWRGPAVKQYQPTAVEWTDKLKKAAGYKKPSTTLVEDHYRVIPAQEPVFWFWRGIEIADCCINLLDALLDRILYFGRAESYCRMRRVKSVPNGIEANCSLSEIRASGSVPVLSFIPREMELKYLLEYLLRPTGEMMSKPTPPGTRWYYAELPRLPSRTPIPPLRVTHPSGLHCIQFAVGGRVLPPMHSWVRLTERFRGRVIKELAKLISPNSKGEYQLLDDHHRRKLSLISGKDEHGKPLSGHRHAYFLLWPDENGYPTRLLAVRGDPFTHEEIEAMLRASERPIAWDYNSPEWKVRLVPMPFGVKPPEGLFAKSRVWKTITPFVPPAERHRFRKGRERSSESIERIVTKLLNGKASPSYVEITSRSEWVKLHETLERRRLRIKSRTPWVRPGYHLKITFQEEVSGPLILGDSCHFGLGLFIPAD